MFESLWPVKEIEWPETVTYDDVERIRAGADVDLCGAYSQNPEDGKHSLSVWEDMLSDVGVTVNVLRLWLGWNDKTLKKRAKLLTAKRISEGLQALEAALDRFFLDLGRGPIFGMLCRVARKQATATTSKIMGPCEQQLETLLAKTIDENFGDLPGLQGSETPAPTNSGNLTN